MSTVVDELRPSTAVPLAPLRSVSFQNPMVKIERMPDGTIYLYPVNSLGEYPERVTDYLYHWAKHAPDRVFMAERDRSGQWRTLTYAQMLQAARRIASALLGRKLSAERPIMILSGNSLDHAMLAFGALHAGIPFAPLSPAYSLVSTDFSKLSYLMTLMTPGLVFADNLTAFSNALLSNVPDDVEIVGVRGSLDGRAVTSFSDLLDHAEAPDLDAVHESIGPDTIAKFLMTSGSTGNPKAVINTQRMLCANQIMLRDTLAFLKDEPPVIVDWLPWNHTFGGNHNIGLTLFNGGSMYLDEGKPTPAGIAQTVANLREISPTVYFNVPKGYESLLPYLRDDAALRKKFFHRLHSMFFSGAALASHIWQGLDELAVMETGVRVPMLTGLGATETSPYFMSVNPETSRSGHVGLPVPGNVAKLVPNNGKLEVRAKGENITPGYWRASELTLNAFDEEGFYKFGDALKAADPDDLTAGFDFDGRIAEDFKLASGTWVSVGPLRARLVAGCAPIARDVVIAGINRDELSALVILDLDGCREINLELPAGDLAAAASDSHVIGFFRAKLAEQVAKATGSSTRIARAVLMATPLSIDRGELTDKGSVNQRAVLDNRAALIEEIYTATPGAHVIVI